VTGKPRAWQQGLESSMASSESLPPEIRTPRLALRRQRPDDARMIKDAVDTSLAHLRSSVAWAQAAPIGPWRAYLPILTR
jgi:hypothetical protein